MITLRQLEVFAAVVRSGGSVTKASARLYVSQPSVSDTLRALEKSLDAKMFSGRGKTRAMTAAGDTYWDYTNQILALIDEAAQAVADLADHPQGKLSIVAVPTAGEYLIPRVLRDFAHAYPDVAVTLMVANRADATEALRDGTADLAIMGRPPAGLPAEATVLAENRLQLLCSPEHDLVGTSPTLSELVDRPFLLRESGSGTRAAVEQVFASRGLELQRTMVLGSNSAVLASVQVGLGLAVVPAVAGTDHVVAGRLVELITPEFPLQRHWHIVWLTTRSMSSPAAAFMTILVDRLSDPEGATP